MSSMVSNHKDSNERPSGNNLYVDVPGIGRCLVRGDLYDYLQGYSGGGLREIVIMKEVARRSSSGVFMLNYFYGPNLIKETWRRRIIQRGGDGGGIVDAVAWVKA